MENELYNGKFQEVWVSPPYGDTFTYDGRIIPRTSRVAFAKDAEGLWRYASFTATSELHSQLGLLNAMSRIRKMKVPEGTAVESAPTQDLLLTFKANYPFPIPDGAWVDTADVVNTVMDPGFVRGKNGVNTVNELSKIEFHKVAV